MQIKMYGPDSQKTITHEVFRNCGLRGLGGGVAAEKKTEIKVFLD